MTAPTPIERLNAMVDDRARLGRVLAWVGGAGLISALVVAIAGSIVVSRAANAMTDTVDPLTGLVGDLADTVAASQVLVSRTTDAIIGIEDATRATARTLSSVGDVLDQTEESALAAADSLDAALDTMPGLISTAAVVDRTMRALSLVGVDYDPEQPLDQVLASLEGSLRPLPGQIRAQAGLLVSVVDDLDGMSSRVGDLAAVLLEARLDMMSAEAILESAAENASTAAARVEAIAEDLRVLDDIGIIIVLLSSLVLAAGATAPLLIGLHLRRNPL